MEAAEAAIHVDAELAEVGKLAAGADVHPDQRQVVVQRFRSVGTHQVDVDDFVLGVAADAGAYLVVVESFGQPGKWSAMLWLSYSSAV